MFSACQIFDRYLLAVGYQNFPRKDVFTLTIISLLIAAKLEEAISPSFLKMLSLVPEAEKQEIDRDKLVDMELKIVTLLNFDFQ